jgi:hypothetical protein
MQYICKINFFLFTEIHGEKRALGKLDVDLLTFLMPGSDSNQAEMRSSKISRDVGSSLFTYLFSLQLSFCT